MPADSEQLLYEGRKLRERRFCPRESFKNSRILREREGILGMFAVSRSQLIVLKGLTRLHTRLLPLVAKCLSKVTPTDGWVPFHSRGACQVEGNRWQVRSRRRRTIARLENAASLARCLFVPFCPIPRTRI
jgi:hypothetical protein